MSLYRLDGFLSEYSAFSRREAVRLVRSGVVSVGSRPVRDPSFKFDPAVSAVTVSGRLLPFRTDNTLMLNKPEGVVSATDDPREKTALSLIRQEDLYPLPFPAGRLDKDVTGLLLLTSDGQYCHRIISPSGQIFKTYEALVDGCPDEEDIRRFAEGLTLSDGERFLPAKLKILRAGSESLCELKICEGRYHQVKRMMAAAGKPVIKLRRTAIGGLKLDEDLAPGSYRRLSGGEKELVFS